MEGSMTRREWLASSAAAAFAFLPAGSARGYAANDRIDIACVGVMNIGRVDRLWLRDGRPPGSPRPGWPGGNPATNIVALCDVDERHLGEASRDHPGAATYRDFRVMLERQREIDAVMVATPDHTHAVISMAAMKLGKHVCTEKPLTHSVYEARALAEAAKAHRVVTQLDNEGHGAEEMRRLVELVRSGEIGEVGEVHVWSSVSYHPKGRPPDRPAPEHLDWDLWLGPAPQTNYRDGLHPCAWRHWWDFGTAALGDFGCHFFDACFWALQLGHPTSVEAESDGGTKEKCPKWTIVRYRFPARGDGLPPVTLTWFDGGKYPPRPEDLPRDFKWPGGGSILIGTKGKILIDGTSRFRIISKEREREIRPPAPTLLRAPEGDHKLDWLRACRGGPPAGSNFPDYAGPLAEVVLLGNVAVRTAKRFEWDPVNLKAKGVPEADPYIRREYRKGWSL